MPGNPVTDSLTPPTLTVAGVWTELFQGPGKTDLEAILPGYIFPRRWFGSKTRTIQAVEIIEGIRIDAWAALALLRVSYLEREPEIYLLPLAFGSGELADTLRREKPQAVVALVQTSTEQGILYDAVWNDRFCQALLALIGQVRQLQGRAGTLLASASPVLPTLQGPDAAALPPVLLAAEQSNTSIRYGERLILKLFRRLEAGTNPDLEIGHFLTETSAFAHTPPVAGALQYQPEPKVGYPEPITCAILQGFVPNQGDAWRYTLEALDGYFERVVAQPQAALEAITLPPGSLLDLAQQEIPDLARTFINNYLASAQLLGQRTAELHLALAASADTLTFAPEPFTPDTQQILAEAMRQQAQIVFRLLDQNLKKLPETVQPEAQQALTLEPQILQRFDALLEKPLTAQRIRIHGDYHLGQVLYTGDDFMIIDFEGEPARPLPERRLKQSPLQDVAGMLRSFHYAAYAALFERLARNVDPAPVQINLEAWARLWRLWVSVAFLKKYLAITASAPFQPQSPQEIRLMLSAYLLQKAVYELGYELNNRPDWVKIPLQGILRTLQGAA